MLRVGLTGGTGSGKSTVAGRLAQLGAVVIDADALARAVVARGTPGLAEVVGAFGPGILADDGSLDRAALGRLVFADPAGRERLEAITHPRIADLTTQILRQVPPGAVVVHDIPLLVEKGMVADYDLVVVVGATVDTRLRRLAARGMSAQDARSRIAAQATEAERQAVADVWLDNDGSMSGLLAAVDALWAERLVPLRGAAAGQG